MSREGTTQEDVAAMQMYSIAIKPRVYEDETNTKKSFQADDGAGEGHLKRYMKAGHPSWCRDRRMDIFPMPYEHYERALQVFAGSDVNVTTYATKYLGGYVGPRDTCDQLTRGKVGTVVTYLEKLSELAEAESHAQGIQYLRFLVLVLSTFGIGIGIGIESIPGLVNGIDPIVNWY